MGERVTGTRRGFRERRGRRFRLEGQARAHRGLQKLVRGAQGGGCSQGENGAGPEKPPSLQGSASDIHGEQNEGTGLLRFS